MKKFLNEIDLTSILIIEILRHYDICDQFLHAIVNYYFCVWVMISFCI